MLRKIATLILIGLTFCFTNSAYAALELELTQGIEGAIPLTVVPFASQNDNTSDDVTPVIMSDLTYSGRFKLLDQTSLKMFPHSAQEVDYDAWRKLGQDDLVVGNIKQISGGRYQVNFQLLGIFNGSQKTGADHVLLDQSFTVNQNQLRNLAHRISDLIYQQLTGVRGAFSTRVAYVLVQRAVGQATRYSIQVADIDGYNPRSLIVSDQPLMSPAWSPDGKQIAFVSFEKQRAQIYIVDVASGRRRVVSNSPGLNNAPAFSPDGKQLAMVLSKTGYPKIYTLGLFTNSLRQITDGWSIDTEPNWAPDGKSILFTSDRGGGPQIYQYSFGSGQVQRITFDGDYNARASFMPDGSGIVVLHRENGLYSIALQDLSSGQMQVLTSAGLDESPSLAPNGAMILYATKNGNQGVLAMVSTDGKVKLTLPAQEGDVQEPAWSPFLN